MRPQIILQEIEVAPGKAVCNSHKTTQSLSYTQRHTNRRSRTLASHLHKYLTSVVTIVTRIGAPFSEWDLDSVSTNQPGQPGHQHRKSSPTSQLQFPTTRRGDTIFPICNLWSKVERKGGKRGKFKYCFVSGTGKTVTLWICMIMEQIVASVLQTEFVVKFTLLLHSGGWLAVVPDDGSKVPSSCCCTELFTMVVAVATVGFEPSQNVWALWFQTLVLTSLGKLTN